MKTKLHLALCLLLSALHFAASAAEEGFVPMFNGKDITGWELREYKQPAPDQWSFKGDVLAAKPGSGWLATTREYENFILRLDWRIPTNGNSGVFLRIPPLKDKDQLWTAGVKFQILDDTGSAYVGKIKPYQFSGSIYGVVPPAKPM